jgi:type IV pilus assembly protein PilE
MIGHRGRGSAGFTLVELMIVVGIVAILAALAISGYGYAMVKSRRSAAEGCLQESAQFMERFYTTNLAYDKDTDDEDVPDPKCSQDVTPYYTVAFAAGEPTSTTYILQAVPTDRQKDSRCGTLSIDNTGKKDATGTGGVAACW